jgi:hypothetical protein
VHVIDVIEYKDNRDNLDNKEEIENKEVSACNGKSGCVD